MEPITATTQSSEPINQQQTATVTMTDSQTTTMRLGGSSQAISTSTFENSPNQGGMSDQAAGNAYMSMRQRTIIAASVSIGGLILVIVIVILIVLIVIVIVKYRRQNKLLNFKIKKNEHRHIGLGKPHIVKASSPSFYIISSNFLVSKLSSHLF